MVKRKLILLLFVHVSLSVYHKLAFLLKDNIKAKGKYLENFFKGHVIIKWVIIIALGCSGVYFTGSLIWFMGSWKHTAFGLMPHNTHGACINGSVKHTLLRLTALIKPYRWNAKRFSVELEYFAKVERKISVIEANQLMCNKLHRQGEIETNFFWKKLIYPYVSCWNQWDDTNKCLPNSWDIRT